LRRFTPVILALLVACDDRAPTTIVADAPCRSLAFENTRFTVCAADPARDRVTLVIDPALRSLPALAKARGEHGAQVGFAMNGGMYDEAGYPIGLAVADGKRLTPLNRNSGTGNFHLLPNGVFSAEADGWHVRTADAYAALHRPVPSMATQSGPMLLIGGGLHPKIAPNGTSLHIRNAVGISADGKAHFVISDQPVSFGRLARMMHAVLGCDDALYLDGAVSALWDPVNRRIDTTVPLGPLLVVERVR